MNEHNTETATNIHHLPRELFTRILLQFEFLRASHRKASLGACSLVCRAWVAPSHRMLFKLFTIYTSKCDLLLTLEVLPGIAQYVKGVSIIYVNRRHKDPMPSLSKVLPMFHNVRTLSIEPSHTNYEEMQLPLAAYSTLLNSFPLVQELILKRCTLATLRIMLPIIGSHQHLESLEVKEHILSDGIHTPPLDLTPIAVNNTEPPNHLLHFTVCGPNSHPILVWLSSHTTVYLTTISVINITHQDIPPLATLLNITGPSLHHLLLNLFSAHNGSIGIQSVEQVRELSISCNTELRSLELRNLCWHPSFFAAWVPNLLAQISSTTMESIVFDLSFYPNTRFEMTTILNILPFERMDSILTSSQFRDLRRVTVEVFIRAIMSEDKTSWRLLTFKDIRTRMRTLQDEERLFVVRGE
ncbi:hypothetical protein K439DRAFT_1661161 [Ramaria rubella]|nr:hypothetical protein K439DRAFT_1661161 [Ramaria rubella]